MQLQTQGKSNANIEIMQLDPEQWSVFSEDAHRASFSEFRPAYMDRIDYALLAHDSTKRGVLGYVTIRELDAESVYWQYGAAFDSIAKGVLVSRVYQRFIDYMREKYKRITTLVENTNVSYLKLAMKMGFRIIGVRNFKGMILVELLLDFEENKNAFPI